MTGAGVRLHAAGHGRAEPHRRRRIGQADLDLEGARDRIGLRRHLAHAAVRRHVRVVGQGDGDLADRSAPTRITCAGTSNTASRPSLRASRDDHLPGLHDLAGARADRGDDARRVRLQLGEARPGRARSSVALRRRRPAPARSAAPAVAWSWLARVVQPCLSSVSCRSKWLRACVSCPWAAARSACAERSAFVSFCDSSRATTCPASTRSPT